MVAGRDRHLDAGLRPPVESRADREHDPVLGRRLVGAGRDEQPGLADAVGLELLDYDAVEEGSQLLAHVKRVVGVGGAPLIPSATMIDPLARWAAHGEKPDFTGLLSFAGQRYTEDPDDLPGVDVAIVGAATDELVSDRPGARMAPRAIRAAGAPPGRHLAAGIDAFAALRVVDFGDAPVRPGDVLATAAAIEHVVGEVVDAGAIPVILGGDHSIAEPDMRAVAARHGPLGLVHFDAHADTATHVFGVARSHGTTMRRLVEDGTIDAARYVQVGLRGYWPDETVFAWQREQGITSLFMHDILAMGIEEAVGRATAIVGSGPAFISIDIDVADPSVAPGTGTPEPGGLGAADLLWAARVLARELEVVGAELVEVIPSAIGSGDVTALLADRIVRELLTGIALRREAGEP